MSYEAKHHNEDSRDKGKEVVALKTDFNDAGEPSTWDDDKEELNSDNRRDSK